LVFLQDTVHFQGAMPSTFPRRINIKQGAVPDCQLLTAIDALVNHPEGYKILNQIVKVQPDGSYKVTFKRFPNLPIIVRPQSQPRPKTLIDHIRVFAKRQGIALTRSQAQWYQKLLKETPTGRLVIDPEDHAQLQGVFEKMPKGMRTFHSFVHGSPMVKVLELAYAQLQKKLFPDVFAHIPDDDIMTLYFDRDKYHYNGKIAFRDLTGWDAELVFFNMDAEGNMMEHPEKFESQLNDYSRQPEKYILNVWTLPRPKPDQMYVDPGQKYPAWHTYSVHKVDSTRREIIIKNPHESSKPLVVPYDDFFKYFRGVTVSHVNSTIADDAKDRFREHF
jgi:hypothetical protein